MAKFTPPQTEETVACNLIPMIDIMFLLLLFFMLGADMSRRENADVALPTADKAKEDKPDDSDEHKTYTFNLMHREVPCALRESPAGCREPDHWTIADYGQEYNDFKELTAHLREIADTDRKDPHPGCSGIKVLIRGDSTAPYIHAQKLIQACMDNKIYKIEVAAARPQPTDKH